jgi:hypothetical protein
MRAILFALLIDGQLLPRRYYCLFLPNMPKAATAFMTIHDHDHAMVMVVVEVH